MSIMKDHEIKQHVRDMVAAWRRALRRVEAYDADALYRNATEARRLLLINYVQNGWPRLILEWYRAEDVISFDMLTVKEMREIARRKGIKFYSTMNKPELIFVLEKRAEDEKATNKAV